MFFGRRRNIPVWYLSCWLGMVLPGAYCGFGEERSARRHCLNTQDARAAIAQGRALALSHIKRAPEANIDGELLRARLCEHDGRLIYFLTILKTDGKVRYMTVDAASGAEESLSEDSTN